MKRGGISLNRESEKGVEVEPEKQPWPHPLLGGGGNGQEEGRGQLGGVVVGGRSNGVGEEYEMAGTAMLRRFWSR